jgi:hypothetical protein
LQNLKFVVFLRCRIKRKSNLLSLVRKSRRMSKTRYIERLIHLKTMNLTIFDPQGEGMESPEKSSDNIESNVPRQEVLYPLSGLIFSQNSTNLLHCLDRRIITFSTNYFNVKVKTPVIKAQLNRPLNRSSQQTAMYDRKFDRKFRLLQVHRSDLQQPQRIIGAL